MKPITIKSKSVPIILRIVENNPGIRIGDLAATAGYSLSHAGNVLGEMARNQMVKAVELGGAKRGWYIYAMAIPLVEAWEKSRRKRGGPKELTQRQKIMAISKDDDGASNAKVSATLGIKRDNCGQHFRDLVKQGRLFLGARVGCRMRWFDSQERADAWHALPAVVPSEWVEPGLKSWTDHPARKRRLVAIGERIKSSARQPSKPPPKPGKPGKAQVTQHGPSKPAGVVVVDRSISFQKREADFSRAKITRIDSPKFDVRYQVDPDSIPRFRYGAQA